MVSEIRANYIINIGLHVIILFTFLTIFFFIYISSLEKKSVTESLDNMINKQTGIILSSIDKTIPIPDSKWVYVNDMAEKLNKDSQGELPSIKKHNNILLYVSAAGISILFMILVGIYLYFTQRLHVDIHLRHILFENTITFILIGIVEFLFFYYIASKYIPASSDVAVTTAIDRIKYNINQYLLN
jgi:hypothetical protein